jgi:predicted RNA-binding protein with PUA-like domain
VRHWLIKSEPFKYSWSRFVSDGKTVWDGVRSFEARNNLRLMKEGDLALFYHSNEGREFVGVAKITRTAYPEPTRDDGDWSVVEFAPVAPLQVPVTLAAVKADARLSKMSLVRRSRLSVAPVEAAEFKRVLSLARTKI